MSGYIVYTDELMDFACHFLIEGEKGTEYSDAELVEAIEGARFQRLKYCEDCKFSRVIESTRFPARFIGKRYCIHWGEGIQGEWVPDRGFCHEGKPREENNG